MTLESDRHLLNANLLMLKKLYSLDKEMVRMYTTFGKIDPGYFPVLKGILNSIDELREVNAKLAESICFQEGNDAFQASE